MLKFLLALVLFGLVIFVHELGHFLAARFFRVKIFVFSLGFGSALVSWHRGETEYRLSAVPLGGYVKMLGENTAEEEIPPEDLPRSFSAKFWWQKVIIVFAGPLTNIVFAVFIYFLVSFFNHVSDATVIEFIAPGGPAAQTALREGDRVLAVNGRRTAVWEDLQNALPMPVAGECPPIKVLVARWPSGNSETVSVLPEKRRYADVFGEETDRCVMGIAALPRDTRVAFAGPVEGLKSGDIVRSVDGRPVSRWYEVVSLLTTDADHHLTVDRDGKEEKVSLTADAATQAAAVMRHGGMLVGEVEPDSVARKAGVESGDLIVAVNGVSLAAPYEFVSEVKKVREGGTVKISLYRGGEPLEKDFVLSFDSKENQYTGMTESNIRWGARFLFSYDLEPTQASRDAPLLYSARYAVEETANIAVMTVKGMYYLMTNRLPAKAIGGPILVFDISQKAAARGKKVFLSVMAMISVNLGILNLLPVPVLDGGHAVMYTWEGLTRRKIPLRVKEWSLRAGVALLMALMVFAMFNDISRYISIFSGG